MGYSKRFSGIIFAVLTVLVSTAVVHDASADVFTSTSYKIDASVSSSVGGPTSSTSYKMVSSGGESVIGNGAGGSYKLGYGYVAQLDKALQLVVQPGSQSAYFPMDENNGTTTFDASVSPNIGTFANGTNWVTGKIGSATNYDGVSKTTTFPDSASLRQSGQMTLTGWLKVTSLSNAAAQQVVISKALSGTDRNYAIILDKTNGNLLVSSSFSGVKQDVNSSTSVSNGAWHYFAYVIDASNQRVYVDGTLKNNTAYSGTLNVQASQLKFSESGVFDGALDEVKLFSRALTAAEVKAEYDAQNAGIPSGLSLNTLTPGASQTATFDAIVQTDSPGYNLAIQQDHNLQFGATTIPAVSGSIASPVTWVEGTTKGLGFTLYSTNATAIPGIWGSGAAYAAIPASSTGFYTRTGYTAGAKDVLNLRLRSDVATSQPSGFYTNMMTVTGTMTP